MCRGENFDITPSQSVCVSMQDCCMVLQSHPDSLTRMVPTHVSARLCARIRDKIDGAPTAPSRSPGFPTCHRATLFSRNDSSLLFPLFSSSAHPPPAFLARPARHEAVFVFLPFVRIPAILLLSLLLRLFSSYPSFSSRHRVGCCSGSIRETRHDSDISLEVSRGRVDHWFR